MTQATMAETHEETPNHSRPSQRNPGAWLRWLAASTSLAGLVAFNVWWYLHDTREVPRVETAARLLGQGEYRAAEQLLRERLRARPRDAVALVTLARTLAGQGDLLACAQTLIKVPEWSSQYSEAMFRAGQSFFQVDHAREAETAWLKLVHHDPLHPTPPEYFLDASQELLKLYAIEDDWEDAFPVIWSAYDRTTGGEQTGWLMSRLRPELERVAHVEAIPHLMRYLEADPSDANARRALGRAYAATGRRAEADAQFRECLKRSPEDARAWRDYLTMLSEQGELDRFLEVLGHPPRSADEMAETWFFRATAAEKQQDWAKARHDLEKAIELHPYTPKYYYRLASVEDRLGERAKATEHRARTKRMNDARSEIAGAYATFLELERAGGGKPAERSAAAKRLAQICETMGWGRAAQAWSRIAVGG